MISFCNQTETLGLSNRFPLERLSTWVFTKWYLLPILAATRILPILCPKRNNSERVAKYSHFTKDTRIFQSFAIDRKWYYRNLSALLLSKAQKPGGIGPAGLIVRENSYIRLSSHATKKRGRSARSFADLMVTQHVRKYCRIPCVVFGVVLLENHPKSVFCKYFGSFASSSGREPLAMRRALAFHHFWIDGYTSASVFWCYPLLTQQLIKFRLLIHGCFGLHCLFHGDSEARTRIPCRNEVSK